MTRGESGSFVFGNGNHNLEDFLSVNVPIFVTEIIYLYYLNVLNNQYDMY